MGNVLFQEWSAKKKSDGMYLSGEEEAEKFISSAIYRYYRVFESFEDIAAQE